VKAARGVSRLPVRALVGARIRFSGNRRQGRSTVKKSLYILGFSLLQGVSIPALVSPALAAEEDDAIIVTARRQEENLQEVPISITVLDEEAIAKRNIFNAGDLGNYVPSLSTNSNFGPEKSSFSIRGFIQEGRTSPSVGVFFADVVAPRANSGTTSGNGAGVGSFMDLENVQVLKGPQGTLFGRNTTGGSILLVPTKPKPELGGYIEGSVGNYDLRRIQGVLNIPLAETFHTRLAVDWHKRDGYLRNRSGIGPDRFGDTDYISARLSIVAKLTDTLENYTIARYSKSKTNGNVAKLLNAPECANTPFVFSCFTEDAGYPRFAYDPASLQPILGPLAGMQLARAAARGDGFWDVENSVADPRSDQELWQIINTTTWEASDNLTIKNIVSYAEFREDVSWSLFGDNFTYPANYFSPLFFVSTGFFIPHPAGTFPVIQIKTGESGNYAAQSTFTEEFQLIGTAADGRLSWQAGAYLEVSKPLGFNSAYNEIFLACSDPAALQCTNNILGFGTISSANIKNFYNNKGFYAQATYDITDQFAITGGIRYTIDKMRDVSRNINVIPTGPGSALFICQNVLVFAPGTPASGFNGPECQHTTLLPTSKEPTWLINLDYKPNNDLLFYAKWARGYRQGSIIAGNLGFETFEPETVDTYEVGAKTSFRGAVSGFFNVAAFYNDFRDQQIAANAVVADEFVGLIPPSQLIVNAGKSRIWGIEVDAQVRPFEGLKIDASYAYLNTRLTEIEDLVLPIFFSDLEYVAEEGGPLAQSPRNRVTVTATYTLPLDESIGRISIGGTYTHTDANDVHTQRFAPTSHRVRAIDLLNLNAEWEGIMGQPIDLAFFMTNVTNQKRVIYPIAVYPTLGSEVGYLNQPRMWGFRLKYRFGDER
jgi:iron complex outermembrane recepter protein